jgi:hypothetical protein
MSDPSVNPSPAQLAAMHFINDIGDDEVLYNNAWDEIKVNIGR